MKKIITIDGPSGVGKTTIGQEIALNLKYSFFSSGKLYRYVSKYSYDEKNYKFDMNNQRKFLILAVLVGIAGVGIGAATIFSMVSELYSP